MFSFLWFCNLRIKQFWFECKSKADAATGPAHKILANWGEFYCKYHLQGIVVFLVSNWNVYSDLLTDYYKFIWRQIGSRRVNGSFEGK